MGIFEKCSYCVYQGILVLRKEVSVKNFGVRMIGTNESLQFLVISKQI